MWCVVASVVFHVICACECKALGVWCVVFHVVCERKALGHVVCCS